MTLPHIDWWERERRRRAAISKALALGLGRIVVLTAQVSLIILFGA
jgi:hypothetical protein